MELPAYARVCDAGIELFVWAKPAAQTERIIGTRDDDKGQTWLCVAVRAAPEDGQANDALITFLAKHFGVRKSAIELKSGATGKQKRFVLEAFPSSFPIFLKL